MKKPLHFALLVFSSLLLSGLLSCLNKPTPVASDHQEKTIAQAAAVKPNAKRDLVLAKVSWQKGEDGSKGFHSFFIHNASKTYNYSTITVRFRYFSDLGDEVGYVDKVIDRGVKTGETIHIDKLEVGTLNEHADGADMEIL